MRESKLRKHTVRYTYKAFNNTLSRDMKHSAESCLWAESEQHAKQKLQDYVEEKTDWKEFEILQVI